MSNQSQLLLLSDHIKLSLLERQRAQSLNLAPNPSQESNISRSLESFRDGLESLSKRSSDTEMLDSLRTQYEELAKQFHGDENTDGPIDDVDSVLGSPNDPSLKADFDHAMSKPKGKGQSAGGGGAVGAKNVRFRDNPDDDDVENQANREALFQERYRDEERARTPDPTEEMDNQQIHEYHQQIMQQQDDQLDRLGESIGRQRYLGMQISDELEGQIALLDEVESGVDRHQSRLDGAKSRLNRVSRKAKDNWGMTTIIVLIVILVLLIALLK